MVQFWRTALKMLDYILSTFQIADYILSTF